MIYLEKKLSHIEFSLSNYSFLPPFCIIAGSLKIGLGVIQTVTSLALFIFFGPVALFSKNFLCKSICSQAWKHLQHGVVNIGMGIVEALPIISSVIYYIRMKKVKAKDTRLQSYEYHFFNYSKIISEKYDNGLTFLHLACFDGDLSLVKHLIEKGLELDAKSDLGETPLHFACSGGHLEIVKELIKRGADPKIVNPKRRRGIHLALEKEHHTIVQELLPYELFPEDLLVIKFFSQQKIFCNKFGLQTQLQFKDGNKLELAGMSKEQAIKEVIRSVTNYASHPMQDERKKIWLKALEIYSDCFINFINPHAFEKEYLHDIIPLSLSWRQTKRDLEQPNLLVDSGHNVGILVSKSKNILIKCNRGEGSLNPGLEVFQDEKMRKTKGVLEQLSMACTQSSEASPPGKKFFIETLNEKLALKKIYSIECSAQSSDNCPIATSKMILRGILFCLFFEQGYSLSEADQLSQEEYKAWSHVDQVETLKEFLVDFEQLEEIMEAANLSWQDLKDEGIIPREILNDLSNKINRNLLTKNKRKKEREKLLALILPYSNFNRVPTPSKSIVSKEKLSEMLRDELRKRLNSTNFKSSLKNVPKNGSKKFM